MLWSFSQTIVILNYQSKIKSLKFSVKNGNSLLTSIWDLLLPKNEIRGSVILLYKEMSGIAGYGNYVSILAKKSHWKMTHCIRG